MNKFRVVLAVEIDGQMYQYGSLIDLNTETAKLYAHALVRVQETEPEQGRKAEGK